MGIGHNSYEHIDFTGNWIEIRDLMWDRRDKGLSTEITLGEILFLCSDSEILCFIRLAFPLRLQAAKSGRSSQEVMQQKIVLR